MNILDATELIQAIDTYELILSQYPEVVPTIGFSVLQQEVNMDKIRQRVTLGYSDLLKPAATQNTGVMTLRREANNSPTTDYFISLLVRQPTEALPRRTATRFKRLGGAVAAFSWAYDAQGSQSELENPENIQDIHEAFARCALLSDATRHLVVHTAERRTSYIARLEDKKTSSTEKKRLKEAIRHAKLK
jgi:hypothetical protein